MECLRFPYAKHDDQVDMLSWIGQMIMIMNPEPLIEEKKPSWRDKLSQFTDAGSSHKSAMSA